MAKIEFTKARLKKSAEAFVFLLSLFLEFVVFVAIFTLDSVLPISEMARTIVFFITAIVFLWFWFSFMAPKAKKRLKGNAYYLAKAVIYVIAAVSIYLHLGIWYFIIFSALSIFTESFAYRYKDIDLAEYFKKSK